ncbi:MAG: hypothetical protein B7X99_14845 [Rhizobiales bacterium 17-65-6]|nr:MAG: hypothetical protein B7X99_14845 [Rhizobiales bacterium 17-65-6]
MPPAAPAAAPFGTIARAPAKPAQPAKPTQPASLAKLAQPVPVARPSSAARPGKPKRNAASTSNVCERELARASAVYNIPLPVLYAVGLQESGINGHLQQYMLNVAGKDYLATSLPDAMRAFNEARAQGIKLIDVGCLQVNYYYHGKKFRSVEQMFNPRLNVDVAAQELRDWRKSQGNWTMAVARYNASKHNVAGQKRYVCAVIRRLVDTGMGDWTPEARSLCHS